MVNRITLVATLGALLAGASAATADIVHWTGVGTTQQWDDSDNWQGGLVPGPDDVALFDNTGASSLPNEVTNSLVQDHTIGGLTFDVNGVYHTTDVGGAVLRVAGDLNFNLNQPGHTTTIFRNGTLNVADPLGYVRVGHSDMGGAWTNVSLATLTAFAADVHEFHVGTKLSGSAYGELTLAETSQISANQVIIGHDGTGTLHLGPDNTFDTDRFVLGENKSSSTVNIVPGGTLNLGTQTRRTSLAVGSGVWDTNVTYASVLDLSGATLNAWLDHVIIGQKDNRAGAYRATLIAGDSGSVNIGPADHTANVIVGGVRSIGIADFGGLDSLQANLNEMLVGIGKDSQGTLLLAQQNTIDARRIMVGDESGNLHTLSLGVTNTILADEFVVGSRRSNALVDIPVDGTLNLGSESRRTSLSVASGVWETNTTYSATLDLSAATLNAWLDHLVVGQKDNRAGAYRATLIAGDSGSVNIGPADHTANVIVGGVRSIGIADFGGLDSLQANLNEMLVGVGKDSQGTLLLAQQNTIDARKIMVGDESGNLHTLSLGVTNTILADEFVVGNRRSNALVDIPAGGTLNLGSECRRTSLSVASGVWETNTTYTATLDLSGATLNAWLDRLVVGQKDNRSGAYRATLIAGDSGSVNIGPADHTANVIVGGIRSIGLADFSGLDSLQANLNEMLVGMGKDAMGTLILAKENTIDARKIMVGDESGNLHTLSLGMTNTILVDEFGIGNRRSHVLVDIPVGGSLELGSPSRRANLFIATGNWDTNHTYDSTVDLKEASFRAYLDRVIIGQKDDRAGAYRGTLRISDHDDNYVDIVSLLIGDTRSTGTLEFGGGTMVAGVIEKGDGTAIFDWTGGTLHVGTFGTPVTSFDLLNEGSGTLAPGTSIGVTEIFGDYQQRFAAAMEIEIGSPGDFDRIIVHQDLTLDGALLVEFTSGRVAGEFPIVEYGSLTGEFQEILIPALSPEQYSIDYGSGSNDVITLTTVPEPGTLLLLAMGVLALLACAWPRRRRATQRPSSTLHL